MPTPHPSFHVEQAPLAAAPRGFASAPVIEQLSVRGIVFRSAQLLPVGTQLALGLHVSRRGTGESAEKRVDESSIAGALPALASRGGRARSGSTFLALHGLVVECHMESTASDEHAYEVTVLFEGVGHEEAGVLSEASRLCRRRTRAGRECGPEASRTTRLLRFGPN